MARIDIHQHLWSPPLLEALRVRDRAPRVRREGDRWTLDLPGEPPSVVPGDDVTARARLVHSDGLDRALVALSTAVGVETLPTTEASPLLAAWEATADDLPTELAAWTAVGVVDDLEAHAAGLRGRLDRRAGLCLPAAALASPAAVERLGPVLAAVEQAGRPLFVHPGPAAAPQDAPAWWPALTDYVAQLQAAWLAFAVAGRPAHPRLRVVFAALAGLAPLHVERLAARGGPAGAAIADTQVFYETSSYGPRAIDAVADVVGFSQLVHGSDRPVVEPPAAADLGLSPQRWDALTRDNPARLLAPDPSPTP